MSTTTTKMTELFKEFLTKVMEFRNNTLYDSKSELLTKADVAMKLTSGINALRIQTHTKASLDGVANRVEDADFVLDRLSSSACLYVNHVDMYIQLHNPSRGTVKYHYLIDDSGVWSIEGISKELILADPNVDGKDAEVYKEFLNAVLVTRDGSWESAVGASSAREEYLSLWQTIQTMIVDYKSKAFAQKCKESILRFTEQSHGCGFDFIINPMDLTIAFVYFVNNRMVSTVIRQGEIIHNYPDV